MKKYLKASLATLIFASLSAPAFAMKTVANGCSMTETANVTISFNGSDKDVTAVKAKLDAKEDEIKTLAADQHFDKFDMQSSNYSINSNGGNGDNQYQYNGNAGFNILPADKALEFMVILTKKGYNANVNVSSYRNGNCNAGG